MVHSRAVRVVLGALFAVTLACTRGEEPGQRCDPATFAPRCGPDGKQRICPNPAFGALVAIPHVTDVQCFGRNECLVDGRSIGCVSRERERCAEPESRRCVAGRVQICRPLNFVQGATPPYWNELGVRCDR